jgi:hypothetical protein
MEVQQQQMDITASRLPRTAPVCDVAEGLVNSMEGDLLDAPSTFLFLFLAGRDRMSGDATEGTA